MRRAPCARMVSMEHADQNFRNSAAVGILMSNGSTRAVRRWCRMGLQVQVPSGGGDGGGAETPASTRLARGLSAELDEVLGRAPPRSPAVVGGFLATAPAPAPAGMICSSLISYTFTVYSMYCQKA